MIQAVIQWVEVLGNGIQIIQAKSRTATLLGAILLSLISHSAYAAAPVAVNDAYSTVTEQTVNGDLSTNDADLDGPNDSYSLTTAPSNGTAVVNTDGTFSYTSDAGFNGVDSFTYTVEDGAGDSSIGIVDITIATVSDYLQFSSPLIISPEDQEVQLGLSVSDDLFNGGSLQDLVSIDTGYRVGSAGSTPTVSSIPSGVSGINVIGYSTDETTTANPGYSDNYQIMNVRIDLVKGVSSGQIAYIYAGSLNAMDQFSWSGVALGTAVLSDMSKVVGTVNNGSNPIFSVVAGQLQIVESNTLQTAFHIEYMTADGDSTNFISANTSVQKVGTTTSQIEIPTELEPTTGKKGFVVLNGLAASNGGTYEVEYKGFNRIIIDLEAGTISGAIAAERGLGSARTIAYSFSDYPLIDLRTTPSATPVSIINSTASIAGDTTSMTSALDDPTIYISAAGKIVVTRALGFANEFTTMYTGENYQRTGYSSIASFVADGMADALFNSNPASSTDSSGKEYDLLEYNVPASAKVGVFHVSWNTIAGDSTNENMGAGFAIVDLENKTSSGSIFFSRSTTPDLVSWDAVPFGDVFFGATDTSGNDLYKSNKLAGRFVDGYPETAKFELIENADGTRTLEFTAHSQKGTGGYLDYQGNGHFSWLGSEPFEITGLPTDGTLSSGSPVGNGDWEVDYANLDSLSYTPPPNATGIVPFTVSLDSTGEVESMEIHVYPVADEVPATVSNQVGYLNTALAVPVVISDSVDKTDGSESQIDQITLTGVPSSVTLTASTGTLTNLGGGTWTADRVAAAQLQASGSAITTATITVKGTNVDQSDVDGDGSIEDGDNGIGLDEYDAYTLETTFELTISGLPTVDAALVNTASPTLTGTATVSADETLKVSVDGVEYTAGDGFLSVLTDGTWKLEVPSTQTIADGTYDVSAKVVHDDGNVGQDTTTSELVVDTVAPPAPVVSLLNTNSQSPVLTGSVSSLTGLTFSVTVNGVVYTPGDGSLVVNTDNTWTLTIPTTSQISEGVYDVVATLTDAAGNSSTDTGSTDLNIDITAPATPTVTNLTTNDATPTIVGTATTSATEALTVSVNGVEYTVGDGALTHSTDGTWALTIPASDELSEGDYEVIARITDNASNSSVDTSSDELVIDLTDPATPTVTAQLSNSGTPTISGTAVVESGETLTVTVDGESYTTSNGLTVDQANDTWSLVIGSANALVDGEYEVVATVTDSAANSATDASTLELVVDLTAPVLPTVNAVLTNSSQPVITGTATIATGETLSVEVDGVVYSTATGELVVNSDGTWTLTLPATANLTDGSYEVLAIVTDAAGNTATDVSSDELEVDTTPPPAPGVTSQTSATSEPTIVGTTVVANGLTLQVVVNGETYTVGDGNLVDNGDGTWALTIPQANALADNLYQVVATLTDLAGNVSTDAGVDELLVDTTAPPTPGVTNLVTNTGTPSIQGTAVVGSGEILTVTVNAITYTAGAGDLVDHNDGTWTLTIPTANQLAEASYDVTATVTDSAGNDATDPSSAELLVDLTAPVVPSVNTQFAANSTPTLTGNATVLTDEVLTVLVNSITYTAGDGNLINNTDGSWSLQIPASNTLADGTYEVVVTVTDLAGNFTSDGTNNELVVDTAVPASIPTVTSLLSNSETPVLSGTATLASGEQLVVTLNAIDYTAAGGHLVVNTDGTWQLTVPVGNELTEGVYNLTATISDQSGNTTQDTTSDELTIDLTSPAIPTVTSQVSNSATPTIVGTMTTDTDAVLTVEVNGTVYTEAGGHLSNNNDGTWSLEIPTSASLSDNSYEVVVVVTDAAGNSSTDTSTNELTVDLTAPVVPTVSGLTINVTNPVITGVATVATGEVFTVELDGVTYTVGDGNLVLNTDGSWALTVPASANLVEGSYSVVASIVDVAGNVSVDTTTNELSLDLTAPVIPTVNSSVSKTDTPTITGTATVGSNETLTVDVNGITYDTNNAALTDDGNGAWSLTLPTGAELVDGTYDVTVTVTDSAGNSSVDTTAGELTVDLTAPVVPTINTLLSNDATPSITGTATLVSGEVFQVTVNGVTYTAGDGVLVVAANGTWTLTVPDASPLTDGSYEIVATVTDTAGNVSSDTSTDELTIDLTPPPAPGVTSQTSASSQPTIAGTTVVANGLTLQVTVNGETYTVGDGNLVDNGDGTWALTIPQAHALADDLYQVVATLTDLAGNVSTDVGVDELVVDTTAPPTPGVTNLVINTGTPTIQGTAVVGTGETLTVTVNGITYTAGVTALVDHADGTWTLTIPASDVLAEGSYDVTATVTDIAGNDATDPSSTELLVDLTAPVVPMVNAQFAANGTPTLTGTATVATDEVLTVLVNNITYTAGDGDLVNNTDGTWTLAIPVANTLAEGEYEVVVTVSDLAGNYTSDGTSNELTVDTTDPASVPTVSSLLSNSETPVVNGTANLASGEQLVITLNNLSYSAGDGNLVVNGDGTWQVTIPAGDELAEGVYNVTATINDEAGNTTQDVTIDEVTIDLTAPAVPTVTSQVSNSATPSIVGAITTDTDVALTVDVDGRVYSEAGGHLVNNGDGTWVLNIPANASLTDNNYDVIAVVTDAAGNSSTDISSTELTIDLTAPAVPTVAGLTINVSNPVITGVANVGTGEVFTVELDGVIYTVGDGNLVLNTDGTWALTVPPSANLVEGSYSVVASIADVAGNVSVDTTVSELSLDLTAPVTPTVSNAIANTATPAITGTATVGTNEVLTVAVNGVVYDTSNAALTNNGNGSWSLVVPSGAELGDGIYDVVVTVLDNAGNSSVDATVDELTVDLTAPAIPTIDSSLTRDATPVITGTATLASGEILQVTLNGTTYTAGDGVLVVGTDGSWSLTVPDGAPLTEGTYDIVATVTDAAGNTTSDTSTNELSIDLTPPPAPGVTSQTTADQTPLITGTVAIASDTTLTVSVNGVSYTEGDGQLQNNADGTWQLQIPDADQLSDSLYQVVATLMDAAGNSSEDPATDELMVDTVAPATPGVTSLVSNNVTPTINGTASLAAGEVLTVEVNGQVYEVGDGHLTLNTDGTWQLVIPAANTLAEGSFDVVAMITDSAGNTTVDPSSAEVLIDTTAPVSPTVVSLVTNNVNPVIEGGAVVSATDTLNVVVNGQSYTVADGTLVYNANQTWSLTVPGASSLTEGEYDVVVTVTDFAGNTSTDVSTDEVVIDLTLPAVPSVNEQIVNSATPTITGNAVLSLGEALQVVVDGVTYSSGDGHLVSFADNTWSLQIPVGNALTEGLYDVAASVIDQAGNVANDASADELTIDLTAPVSPTVDNILSNSATPVLTGTALVAAGEALSVEVNGVTYTVGDAALVLGTDGVWALTLAPDNALVEGSYNVVATVSDISANTSIDTSVNELVIDLTAPATPTVTSQISNSANPVISGTATLEAGSTLSVEVNGVVYVAGDGHLVVDASGAWQLTLPSGASLPEGTSDVIVTVTDAAGNTATDISTAELSVDLTAPVIPTVVSQLSNSATPEISGAAQTAGVNSLNVQLNGVTYSSGDGSLIDHQDGTWSLTPSSALADGVYEVIVSLTDVAGNISTDISSDELTIDLTAPAAAQINSQSSASTTPVIKGTAVLQTGEALTVTVNGVVYTEGDGHLVVNENGTFELTIPATNALPDGEYDVLATVTDAAGNQSVDSTTNELSIDSSAPEKPIVDSLTTNSKTPVITGSATLEEGETLTVSVNGTDYMVGDGFLTLNVDGTWSLAVPDELEEGSYSVVATVTDAFNNQSSAQGLLFIDHTVPLAPGVLSQTTNDSTPLITGTTAIGNDAELTVEVNGVVYHQDGDQLTVLEDGTWFLQIDESNNLNDGLYQVIAKLTDSAGNVSTDAGFDELMIDTVSPNSPGVLSLITNDTTPHIEGTATINEGDVLTVEVNGVVYTGLPLYSGILGGLIFHENGDWDLVITDPLQDGQYEVIATVTDSVGNSSVDPSRLELIVDTVAPEKPGFTSVQTNTSSPVLTGTAVLLPGEVLTVEINGETYTAGDGVLIVGANGSWTLDLAGNTLENGAHKVTVSVTDAAGNETSVNATVTVDTQKPLLEITSSLSPLSVQPVIAGLSDQPDGSRVNIYDETGALACSAIVTDGRWSCQVSDELEYGTHDFVIESVDLVGNVTKYSFELFISDDFDNDGIKNSVEGFEDFDKDGLANSVDPDADNDGLLDAVERNIDTDGDGLANYLDLDADNDGILDAIEGVGNYESTDARQAKATPQLLDTDKDGIFDYLDLDSDQDGIPDIIETDGDDEDVNGRSDNFVDENFNGVDDAFDAFPANIRDTDQDGLPDYRDRDSDNDGIYDLVEAGGIDTNNDGVVDSANDVDGDGIPDAIDVSFTEGSDDNGNGIDDTGDAYITMLSDMDGDGIIDIYDPDMNGDGIADTTTTTPSTGGVMPDLDGNGVPDYQQSKDDGLHVGLSGHGGCSITDSSTKQAIDPVLPLMALFALLNLLYKSGVRNMTKNLRSKKSVLGLLALGVAYSGSAQSFDKFYYGGVNAGASYLSPDDQDSVVKVTDENDIAYGLFLGSDLTKRWSAELQYTDLGESGLSNKQTLGYQTTHLSALYRGGDSDALNFREGLSYYARLGLGRMSNTSKATYTRDNDLHLLIGAGLEFGWDNGVAVRGEVTSFDTDAHYAGLSLLYRMGGASEALADEPLATSHIVVAEQAVVEEVEEAVSESLETEPAVVKAPESPAPVENVIVYFETESSAMAKPVLVRLDRLATTLKENDKLLADINGYADPTGPAAYNLWLSEARGKVVSKYLKQTGVEAKQLRVFAHGETTQFGDVSTAEGLQANRRVVVLVRSLP